MSTTAIADEVYMYTGREKVPKDVISVQIHPSITEIPSWTFEHCKKLKTISFNEGLVKIGEYAFQKCSSLSSICFPSTLIEIDCAAFYYCTNLREVVFNEGIKKIGTKSFEYCHSLESITLPSSITSIGNSAFCSCNSLRVTVLNERIQKLEDFAFFTCEMLREVVLLGEGVYHMGRYVFSPYPLESFKLPCLSSRLESIIEESNQRKIIMNKINAIREVERSNSELLIPARYYNRANWKVVREIIDKIISVLDYYEVKEATTTIELAFWKAGIQCRAEEIKHNDIDRRGCCIDVPGPVKDTILQYLAYRIYPRGKREKQAFATTN